MQDKTKKITSLTAAAAITLSMGAALPASADNAGAAYAASAITASADVKVTFDAKGGELSAKTGTYQYGKRFGSLPTPTRDGYSFEGWYTADGRLVTEKSVLTAKSNTKLIAHWTGAKKATLKFNGNGGTVVGAKKKTYKSGTKMGNLPNAKKSGYVFTGWYTKKSGGTRVDYKTKLSKCKNRTFYAHYSKASVANLKYKFSNSYEGFGYNYYYRTPYKRYAYIFDKNYADWLYYTNGLGYSYWGGNCFGMSSTAAFNASGKMNLKTFNKSATFNKDLSVKNKSANYKLTVGEYCEAAQLLQFNWDIQEDYDTNAYKYSSLATKVKKCQKAKGLPVVIGVLNGNSGHAILGYKWTKVNKHEDRIYVYDCNYPSKKPYITLYKNSSGKYYSFKYEDYTKITYFNTTDVLKIWQNRGKKSASGMSSRERAYYGVDAMNAKIYDANGKLYATITNGKVSGGDAFNFKILADKLDSDDVPVIVGLPAGEYTIKSSDGDVLTTNVYYDGETLTAAGKSVSIKSANGVLSELK